MKGLVTVMIEAGGKCPKSGIFRKKRHKCEKVKGYGYRCIWCGKDLHSLRMEEK